MPLWGTKDTKTVTGTITTVQNSRTIAGSLTAFKTELKPGQTLLIAGVEYQIAAIDTDTSLTLRIPYVAVGAAGLTVTANEQPAYLSQLGPDNTIANSDLPVTFGISQAEAAQSQNRGKGINTPGWVRYKTYTDAQSNTRHRAETLVAFAGITGDADGATFPDVPVITISVQPASISRVAPATGTFSVTASATNSGVLSYQWQKQEAGDTNNWTDVGTNSNSYTTPATTVAADNGDKYRVIVSATLGAVSVTSSTATLTVTAV